MKNIPSTTLVIIGAGAERPMRLAMTKENRNGQVQSRSSSPPFGTTET